ncbi:hypothetical protein PCANC_18673 [Puccinia coronata f. sp. avenae]|uniref:Helicase ATP-binding domain-containing protein n=1 Tax=Puccinia coronata f. sp. avenae TaxID=200324 RepID=A0A2N5VC93_9BASI|nr:hypothetical protein PCANC_18673 [Puccinia coronata f. sp. avenae]
MVLGKTLTTLASILKTSHQARDFGDSPSPFENTSRCGATLVICPKATLTNWEHEITTHFAKNSIPYSIFYGRGHDRIPKETLKSSMVVLTSYDLIGTSGNPLRTNQNTIESLNMEWYRIVLDEAHMIRNPETNQTINIQRLRTSFVLCLSGTPFQNRVTDIQSLITLLKIWPWDQE